MAARGKAMKKPRASTSDELGRLLRIADRNPALGREEEAELCRRWQRHGDRQAADVLARAHQRLVLTIAFRFRRYGVPLAELVAEGNFGFVHALGKFDPERGVRLVTYAAYWIRSHVLNHIIKARSLVGGGSGALRSSVFFKIRRERVRAANLLGEGEAADRWAAERLGMTPEELSVMAQRLEAHDVSLDRHAAPDSNVRLVDLLPASDDQEQRAFERQVGGGIARAVERAVSELDPRERYIAERRLMADPSEELSLAEIGRSLGISRERARQLELRTKKKLSRSIPALGDAAANEWLRERGAGREAPSTAA